MSVWCARLEWKITPAQRVMFSRQKRSLAPDPHVVVRTDSRWCLERGRGARPEETRRRRRRRNAKPAQDVPRICARRRERVDHIFPRFFTVSSLTVQRVAAIAFLLFLPMVYVHHDDLETVDGATCLSLSLFIGRAIKNGHERWSFVMGEDTHERSCLIVSWANFSSIEKTVHEPVTDSRSVPQMASEIIASRDNRVD